MPSFQINEDEWDALFDEPHHLLKVYCGIRRHMDFATGIAGMKRRLSEQMLRELLSTPTSPGRPGHTATRKEVRYAVDSLVRIGLLVPQPSLGPFVFELPRATCDTSASERWGRISGRGGARGGAVGGAIEEFPEASSYEGFSVEAEGGGAGGGSGGLSEVGPEVGPTSGLPPELPTTSSSREGFDSICRFTMHDQWAPSEKGWRATATRNGIQPGALSDEALMEFRSYWINRPDKHQSQGQWEHELAQALKRSIRRNESNRERPYEQPAAPSAAGNQRPRRQGSLSAVDRVRANIEAAEAARQALGAALAEDGGDVRAPLDVEFWRHPEP
ncbi:hypothetical protein D3C78_987440 [compost metagenome]